MGAGEQTIAVPFYNEGIEHTALRQSVFYKEIRPWIQQRLVDHPAIVRNILTDERKLTIEDRYFFKLDLLFGNIFTNISTRLFWKECVEALSNTSRPSVVALESFNKAYENELTVLFERLCRIIALLQRAHANRAPFTRLQDILLETFPPELLEKRAYTHHRLYGGFPGLEELKALEASIEPNCDVTEYYNLFQHLVSARLRWYEVSEGFLAHLLESFLAELAPKIWVNGSGIPPSTLEDSFSIGDKLNIELRRKRKHKEFFYSVKTHLKPVD